VLVMTAVTEWGRRVSAGESRAGVSRRGLVLRSSEACRVKCACFARAEMIVVNGGAVVEGGDGVVC
jgi:hypothetical protein